MAGALNPIQRYKRDRGVKFKQLAQEWGGMSESYLRKLASYQRPSPDLAKAIEAWTSGAITAAELLLGDHLDDAKRDIAC